MSHSVIGWGPSAPICAASCFGFSRLSAFFSVEVNESYEFGTHKQTDLVKVGTMHCTTQNILVETAENRTLNAAPLAQSGIWRFEQSCKFKKRSNREYENKSDVTKLASPKFD